MLNKYERVALQYPNELAAFVRLLQQEQVRSYLEIGSKFGGSFWVIGRALPKGSRMVSVDLPHGDLSFKEGLPHLQNCVERLKKDYRHDTHLFVGDSTDPTIIEKVRELGPFDACLIDANHTEPYVRADWASYGQMARVVAFHDIGWRSAPHRPISKKFPIQVPIVWAELKSQFRHVEIKMDPTGRDNGFGVLWRC